MTHAGGVVAYTVRKFAPSERQKFDLLQKSKFTKRHPMTIFFTLLLGHLIADFPLQTNSVFQLKCRSSRGLTVHVGIHVLVTAILLMEPMKDWAVLLFLGGTHFLIDWSKLRVGATYASPGFVLDQLAHVSVLLLIAFLVPDLALRPMPAWLLAIGLALVAAPVLAMFLWVVGQDLAKWRDSRPGALATGSRAWLLLTQRGGLLLVASLGLTWLLVT